MKTGDLIRLSDHFDIIKKHPSMFRVYIVRKTEEKSNWVYVYGKPGPIQMDLMEIVSEGR